MKWIALLLTLGIASCTGAHRVPDGGADNICVVDVNAVDDGCVLAP